MITKPLSYVKNMQWNNSYYLQQERPIKDLKFLDRMNRDEIPVCKIDDILSPIMDNKQTIHQNTQTRLSEVTKDQQHPLWKDEPAFTYTDNSWMSKDFELAFAQGVTNTVAVDFLPESVQKCSLNKRVTDEEAERLENIIRTCYVGDAVQRKLPRDFEVPFTGWHPVESRMRPRNQYDWKAMSWGWKAPREFGVPNRRRLVHLSQALVKEAFKSSGHDISAVQMLENTKVRQFIRRPDGKLVRLYLTLPLMLTARNAPQPLDPPHNNDILRAEYKDTFTAVRVNKDNTEEEDKHAIRYYSNGVPDLKPLNPVSNLFKVHIYEEMNNFPIKCEDFSHPHVHTVFYHNASNIRKRYSADKERSKCLLHAYAAALGQARLLQGMNGADLSEPIRINSVSTNGNQFTLSTFQLNSLHLNNKEKPNYFYFHAEPLQLFQTCGISETGQVAFEGLNMDTYHLLNALLTSDLSTDEITPNRQSASV